MASTASPYGFIPIGSQSGIVRTLRMPQGIANSYASNIFKYQPVKLVSGVLQPVTATSDQIFGIFAGCEFTPSGGRPAVSPYWPSGTTYDGTFDMNAYIWPAWLPDLRLAVQANGSVAIASFGKGFLIVAGSGSYGIAAGSTSTGLSQAGVNATPQTTGSQGQFALVEFSPFVGDPASAPGTPGGDSNTDLIVSVAYPQVVSGYQVGL